jgi:tetratricopeptide (TPR) repeat protein
VQKIALDSLLTSALTEMSVADWPAAQKLLAARLEQIQERGNHRLNLFLLSISAASGGYQDVANQLWSQAQQAPLEANAVRYFDLQLPSNDPRQSMLIDLERAWWDFNSWNQTGTLTLALERADQAIDWNYVVEATLDGGDAGLEERYGREFDNQPTEGIFLWNLLALAYLQAGNVRTYDEMVQTAPPPPPPNSVPADLVQALKNRNLDSALAVFQQGQWLTNAALFASADTVEPSSEPEENLTEAEWTQHMIEGFAFIELGQYLQASRAFQEVNFRTDPSQRLVVSRNALALAFFKQGDYTQCERVYEEFRNLLAQFPVSPDSELAQEYKTWLESVDSAPEDSQPFFSPFDGTRSTWNEAPAEEIDFWEEFDVIVGLLGDSDHVKALAKLQKVEISLGAELDTFQSYLLSVMFLAGFVMAGDHGEVQEIAPQVASLEAAAVFPEDKLDELGDTLRWAGFETFYARITGGPQARLKPLNPWDDLAIDH